MPPLPSSSSAIPRRACLLPQGGAQAYRSRHTPSPPARPAPCPDLVPPRPPATALRAPQWVFHVPLPALQPSSPPLTLSPCSSTLGGGGGLIHLGRGVAHPLGGRVLFPFGGGGGLSTLGGTPSALTGAEAPSPRYLLCPGVQIKVSSCTARLFPIALSAAPAIPLLNCPAQSSESSTATPHLPGP